jgi:hypothetical protein
VQREALVDQRPVVGDRVAVAGQQQLDVQLTREGERLEVVHERLRPLGRPVARPRDQRVGGDVGDQMVTGDQHLPLAIVEDRVRGRVARAVVDVQGAVAQRQLLPVAQRPRDLDARAPGAEGARDRLQRGHDVPWDAVAQHDPRGELVVRLRLGGEVLQVRDRDVDGGDLGARGGHHERDQPQMVDVLMGDDHQLDLLERVAECLHAAAQLVERGARVRARVHQRQRLVLDQVGVHAPDRERRRDGHPVDPGGGGWGEGVLGQARLTLPCRSCA